jgi:hypothetical protein
MEARARKAVICVFDGLRPDLVSRELTPNLWRFAVDGTWLSQARSVFPSMTRVATTSFATGSRPRVHGIVNNAFFHRAVIPDMPLDTSKADHIALAEQFHKGRFVEAAGFGCALADAGKRYCVVHSGSAGSAYLVNHRAPENGHWTFSIHGRDFTRTPGAVDEVVERFGPLPRSNGAPKFAEADYSARVLTDHVMRRLQPDVALIWFSEPDTSYHYRQIGSRDSTDVTRRVDACFGSILDAIYSGPDAADTMVVAMSDHGQITMTEEFDLIGALNARGFRASSRLEQDTEILVTHGSSSGLTLLNPDRKRLQDLAATLMHMPETGMVFSRGGETGADAIAGTLAYSLIGIDHPRAPNLYWLARSSTDPDPSGLPGTGLFTGGVGVPIGGGMHGGLNRHELNTMLAFGGAGIDRLGQVDDAADLTCIVPTVLTMLGVPVPATMTGRPIAAVTGENRVHGEQKIIDAEFNGFRQRIAIMDGVDGSVVLDGGRLN